MPPPFINETFTTLTSNVSAVSSCAPTGGVKIALGVIGILLVVSEFLSLNKKIPAAGIVQGMIQAFAPKIDPVLSNDIPLQQDVNPEVTALASHMRDSLGRLNVRI